MYWLNSKDRDMIQEKLMMQFEAGSHTDEERAADESSLRQMLPAVQIVVVVGRPRRDFTDPRNETVCDLWQVSMISAWT